MRTVHCSVSQHSFGVHGELFEFRYVEGWLGKITTKKLLKWEQNDDDDDENV